MSAHDDGSPDSKERLAALGRIMGELVHDLNNEVMVLQGWAMLARGELEVGRLPGDEVERVVGLTDGMACMLRDLLDTVAGRALSPEVTFDPLALTEASIDERVRGFSSATIRFEASLPDAVRVRGRSSFWVRSFANLLSNATRHARARITVSLTLRHDEVGSPTVVLRVEDDGIGVSPEDRQAIFDPLWRGERGEIGLGLSSVRWAVTQLGGTVEYRDDSSLGGAAFEVCVPAAPPLVVRSEEKGAASALEPIRGSRILIVDDDPAVRHAMSRLLQRSGVDARELDPDGEPEAHLLQAVLSALPDVVLLDLRLGDRGGLALWNRMCLEVPHLAGRVIFVSGASPGEPDWEQARRTGQPMLSKPFDLHDLANIVRRLRAEQ